MDAEKKLKHAVTQDRYQQTKMKTHTRKQVWVPKDKIDDFEAVMKRLQKKWR